MGKVLAVWLGLTEKVLNRYVWEVSKVRVKKKKVK